MRQGQRRRLESAPNAGGLTGLPAEFGPVSASRVGGRGVSTGARRSGSRRPARGRPRPRWSARFECLGTVRVRRTVRGHARPGSSRARACAVSRPGRPECISLEHEGPLPRPWPPCPSCATAPSPARARASPRKAAGRRAVLEEFTVYHRLRGSSRGASRSSPLGGLAEVRTSSTRSGRDRVHLVGEIQVCPPRSGRRGLGRGPRVRPGGKTSSGRSSSSSWAISSSSAISYSIERSMVDSTA
jgi:hypothetical protein